MPIRFSCPACHASYTIKDEQGGKKLRCRNCQAVIVAPTTSQDDEEANDSESRGQTRGSASSAQRPVRRAPEEDKSARSQERQRPTVSSQRGGTYPKDDEDDEEDRPRSRRPRAAAAGNRTPWIIGGVIGGGGLFLGLIVSLVVLFRSEKPSTPPPAPVAAVANQRIQPPPEPAASQAAPASTLANTPAKRTKVPPVVNRPAPAVDLATSAPANNGQLTPETMRKVKRATVFLLVRMADGSMASGSGFLALKPGLILTNAHVLGMLEPESSPPQAVEATLNSGERDEKQFGVQIIGVDQDSDLAILRAGTAGMPEPLDVKSASNLVELQKVYVFGFPFGSQLGREITIRESSVASLRKKNGILHRVQVNGGMDPGNSGGPVVDAHGAVVGVAVSGIRGTSINFAVPGDRVHVIMNGRLVRLGLHQPYQQDANTMLPVVAELIDPFNRISQVAVEVWTGDKGKPRPPSDQQPKPLAGDSEHQRQILTYKQGEARGDLVLPLLPPGKVYWIQPSWVNGNGQTHWAAATVHALAPPVERKPVRLQVRHQTGSRLIDINSSQVFKIHSEAGGPAQKLTITIKTQMQENIYDISAQGAMIRLYYTPKFKMGVDVQGGITLGDEDAEREVQIQKLTKVIHRLSFNLCVDARGKLTSNHLDLRKVPDEIRDRVKGVHEQIQHSLEALAVPLPNRQVQVHDSWTDICPLPIDAVGKYDSGSMQMVYTYLGTRRNAKGREEAVIKLAGKLRGLPGREQTIGGNTAGQAVIDVATGQVREAHVTVNVDMRAGLAVYLTGTLRVDLKRPL